MTVLPALAFGLALGVRHATDADHIAAIGTIVSDGRSTARAAILGGIWGIGHSVSVLLVGGALVLFRLPMPPRWALALEFLVALMLIGLGVRSLMLHRHQSTASARRPLLIGIVHGLAGSAVLALLVTATTSTAASAALYLLCFCLGTIIGMSAVSAVLSLPARLTALRGASLQRGIRIAAGVASLVLGLVIAHRVGVRDGLFAATPSWTP
jgi:high-affinity nickel-transport protein